MGGVAKYLKRVSYYSREQLLPFSRLTLSLFMSLFVLLLISVKHEIKISYDLLIIPTLTVFFLLLYYRISDEFKDFETDKKYFPDRPIPSGRVHLSDLSGLLVAFSTVCIVMNLILPFALKEFFAAWIFTVLMGKWFFMEKWISNNRIIAFVTHSPVGFFLSWYLIRYYLNYFGIRFEAGAYVGIFGFLILPGLSWEILRKTYRPEDEMKGYQTYSAMLGFKGALLLGGFFIVLTAINNYLLISHFSSLLSLRFPLTVLNILMLAFVAQQMIRPVIKNLRLLTELYMTFHMLIPTLYLLWLLYV